MAKNDSPMYQLDEIPRGTYTNEGLTRIEPAWIDEYIVEQEGEEARDAAWRVIIPQWLRQIGDELLGDYRLDETDNFTILQPQSVQEPGWLGKHAEKSLGLVSQYWDGIVSDEGAGKHVIIAAATPDDYYQYLSPYYPDGEHGGSGGVCIRSTGYTHIVLNAGPAWVLGNSATHEIAHCLLAHLPLPIWLEEGMVRLAEEYINDIHTELPDVAEHRAYWSEHTLAGFWLGSAFHESDEGQKLAYGLARHMVYELALRDKKKFQAFVKNVTDTDGGKRAAQEYLGYSLSRCLPEFLRIEFAPPR